MGVEELQHPTHLNMKLIQNEPVFHQDSFFILVWYLKIIHESKVTFKNSWVTTTCGEHCWKYLLAFATWTITWDFQGVSKKVLKWESKKRDGMKMGTVTHSGKHKRNGLTLEGIFSSGDTRELRGFYSRAAWVLNELQVCRLAATGVGQLWPHPHRTWQSTCEALPVSAPGSCQPPSTFVTIHPSII